MRVAEVQLSYKTKVKPSERQKVTSSESAKDIFMPFFDEDIEYIEKFCVMFLSRNNKVLGIQLLSIGGTSGTYVDPKIILQGAILSNSSAIILCHNHPSGNTRPSEADITITKKIKQGAELFDISVLDHIILTTEGYLSMADEGII
jgi:DNA repair protein RadC